MPRALTIDLPYPTITATSPDIRSANILSFGYATADGELDSVLQYIYHSLRFTPYGDKYSELLQSIAIAEMKHVDLLGQAMLTLGLDPRYTTQPNKNQYYSTEYVSYSKTPTKMVLDDYKLELEAIAIYNKMLTLLDNEQVSALISRIILDEQLHAKTFRDLLIDINTWENGVPTSPPPIPLPIVSPDYDYSSENIVPIHQ